MTESLLEYHSRLDDLISKPDYSKLSKEDLEAMFTRLEGEINFMEYKLDKIKKRLEGMEPAFSQPWRETGIY